MKITIIRTYGSKGTNGILYCNGTVLCKTIELPWKNNARKESCIPEGEYSLKLRYSAKYGWHVEVCGVPHRNLILVHPANNALKELKGCIAPVTTITGEGRGSQSRVAFKKLTDEVFPHLKCGSQVTLTIKKNLL